MLRPKNASSSSSYHSSSSSYHSSYEREVEPLVGENNSKSWDPIRDAWSRLSLSASSFTHPQSLRALNTLAALLFVFGIMYHLGSSGMNYTPQEEQMPSLNIRGGVMSEGAGGMTGLYADQEQQDALTESQIQAMDESQQQQDAMMPTSKQQEGEEGESPEYEKAGMLMSQQAAAMDAGLMPNHLISNSAIEETEDAGEFDLAGMEAEEEDQSVPFEEGNLDEAYEEQPPPADTEEGDYVSAEVADGEENIPTTSEGTGDPDLSLDALSHYQDSWEPLQPLDNPVFWHIPKAGGSTVKDIIGTCHRFVMATEFGVTDGHDQDTEIAVVYPDNGSPGQDRSPFVNVDTTTIPGIQRAKEMGFADSGLADAIVTPFIYEANDLFTPTAKGRLFTVFRHPIDRAISLFYYIQVADWEPTYSPELANWSIEDYARSDIIENNWMTRQLSNTFEGDLNDDHLKIAMEVIRRKFLVGLMTEIEKTMERFERFFRWTYHVNPPNQENCRERLLSGGSNKNASGNKKEKPKEGDDAYELLRWQNLYDLQLYNYIVQLFEEQEQFVANVPPDFRNVDATCCKCDPPTFPPEGFTCPLAITS